MTFDSIRFRSLPLRSRIATHLQSSLLRNGYALVFNSMATSALGVLYWMLAAHYYSADVVGINAALINTMLFLAQSAQLNLTNGLNRFLPVAGRHSTRFILSVYAVGLLAAPLVCLIYFWGVEAWASSIHVYFAHWNFALFFVLATMAWSIFALQDSVLVGLRQATWVPVENLLFAVAKIILLVALVHLLPTVGIFVSWVVPMALLLLPVNVVIFRHLTPSHVVATHAHSETLTVRSVARYVAVDYLGSLVMTATTGLLPLLVLEQAGAATNAYFSIAWTIANSLYLISRNMGMSLVSEAALAQDKLAHYRQRVLAQTFKVLVPITLVVVLSAPWLLRLFGQAYSSEATTLLRLLALSSVPAVIPSLYSSVGRVQRRLVRVFAVQVVLCGLVVILSYLLLKQYGITGIGLAWLIGQSVVALALILHDTMFGWEGGERIAGGGWQVASDNFTEPRREGTPVTEGRARTYADGSEPHASARGTRARTLPLLQLTIPLRNLRATCLARYRLMRLQPRLNKIILQLQRVSHDQDWQIHEVIPTSADTMVLGLGRANGQGRGVLKLPLSYGSIRYSQQQQQILTALHAHVALGEWRRLVPRLILVNNEDKQHYVVESLLEGMTMQKMLASKGQKAGGKMQEAAIEAIGVLHRATAQLTTIQEGHLQSWIWQPVEQVKTLYPGYQGRNKRAGLDRLAQRLSAQLLGKSLAVGWTHGDFAPCNILVAEDGSRITGIVDWEQSLTQDLPMLDLLFLVLTTRSQLENCELGSLVGQLLRGLHLSLVEQTLLTTAQQQLPGEPVAIQTLYLLTWLRHVSMTIDKSDRYRRNLVWRRNNVDALL